MPSDDMRSSGGETLAVGDGGEEGQDSSTAIKIKVKSLNGADFDMEIPRDILVSELKTKVRERTEVDEVQYQVHVIHTPRIISYHTIDIDITLLHVQSIQYSTGVQL